MMPASVLLIDFYDSFTFNISSQLLEWGIECRVVPYDKKWQIRKNEKAIIWGPGPGHPREYKRIEKKLKKYFSDPKIFHMGICLGHQLFFYYSQFQIEKAKRPIHGRGKKTVIPKWKDVFASRYWDKKLTVQHYNSLVVVKKQDSDEMVLNRKIQGQSLRQNEIVMAYGPRWISYQFHPESIATEERKCFFDPLINFLYNK